MSTKQIKVSKAVHKELKSLAVQFDTKMEEITEKALLNGLWNVYKIKVEA